MKKISNPTSRKSSKHYIVKPLYLILGATLLSLAGLASANALKSKFMSASVNLISPPSIGCKYSFSINRPSPSPSPSTPPVACNNCQYQADLFWGPLIENFAGGVRYSTGRRLITSNFNKGTYPSCNLSPVTPLPTPIIPVLPTGCENPVLNGYLVGRTDRIKESQPTGYITGYITNTTANCTYQVGFATYKSKDRAIETQNLYDYKLATITPGQSITLNVKTPMVQDAAYCHNLP